MKMTCNFPDRLSPALRGYTQEVLCGVIQGAGRLQCDIQKIIEWVGISYGGNQPLPLSTDHFRIEVKLGFVVCFIAVPSSAAFNVDVCGSSLASRVEKEFRDMVLLMIEEHIQKINTASQKAKQLLV